MRLLGAVVLLAWVIAAGAGERKSSKASTAMGAESSPKTGWVVAVESAPLHFEEGVVIGELAEGTRLQVLQHDEHWSLVRVSYGASWVEGLIRSEMIVPDSLADIEVKLASGSLGFVYDNRTSPAGTRFLIVSLKMEASERCPRRLYLGFADEASADVYVTYGRQRKALPYGFWRDKPMSKRQEFVLAEQAQDRKQVLFPKSGEPLLVTYVFLVPATLSVSQIELVIKGKVLRLETKRGS